MESTQNFQDDNIFEMINLVKMIFSKHSRCKYSNNGFRARYRLSILMVIDLFIKLEGVSMDSLLLTLNYLNIYPTWCYGYQNSLMCQNYYQKEILNTITKISDLKMV